MSLRYGLTGLLIMAPAVLGCGAAGAQGFSPVPTPPVPQALAPRPVAKEARLTLAQALAEAQRQAPLVRASESVVESAWQGYQAARLPLDLQVSALSGYSSNTNKFTPFSLEDLTVTGILETSGRQRYRTRAGAAQYRAAQSTRKTTLLDVSEGAENAYIALQVANRILEAQTDLYNLVARQTALTEEQLKVGTARENDLIRMQIALTQAEQAVLQAQTGVSAARAALNAQLGRKADQPVDAADPLQYTPQDVEEQRLQTVALENRPELAAERSTIENLQAQVGTARAAQRPDVALTGRPYGLAPGNSDLLIGAGVVFPLSFGAIHHQVRQAQANVQAEQARLESVRNQISLDVRSAVLNLQSARKIVDSYENGIVGRARSLVERTQRGFEVGGSTILDVIDAQTTYRTSLVSYYQAIGAHQQALAQLKRAVGTATLSDVVAQPGAGRS